MNYRHQYHAGNFADVCKHILLLDLLQRLQQKEKGILYLDTHAGRGVYDLAEAAQGPSLARKPEHPDGWGRLSTRSEPLPPAVARYVEAVKRFQTFDPRPRVYPGSPRLIQAALRPQDRMHLRERHPEEAAVLAAEFARARRVSIETADGYGALAATLPPPERRALVLIDPPYESTDEFEQIEQALAEGLRRLPRGCYAVWYPLSRRAQADRFLARVAETKPAPCLVAEVTVASPESGLAMWGSGLLVLNPPFGTESDWRTWLPTLAGWLAQGPGAGANVREWVREQDIVQ